MKNGFSLVELSIVLVILGLLTGGILSGQSLIRAAELRSVTTEARHYQTAAMTFRDRYLYFPGDMPNATEFWGAIDPTPSNCIALPTNNNVATCNGNGDGKINASIIFSPDGYERYHFWLQLANAGLIEGNYTGVTGTAGNFSFTPGVNVPRAKLANTRWVAFSFIGDFTHDTHLDIFPRTYNYSLSFNIDFPSDISGAPLRPEESWNIDSKIDDGKPATGAVFTSKSTGSWSTDCATSDAVSAEYALTRTNNLCQLWLGF